jgi:PAS domain S-box-containing protein
MQGRLTQAILDALLDTIPVELTVLDENDRIIGWNTGRPRIFGRSPEIMGRDVRACHSERSLGTLERMLREMKEGTRESARFWYDEVVDGASQKILVEYYALRDRAGRYLGCVEALQGIGALRSLEGEKRTLD